MPKIRVSFEAEISDLASYYPDDPPGVTRENVVSFVHSLQLRANDQHMRAYLVKDEATRKALVMRYTNDVKLAERVMKNLVVEVIP